MTTAIEVLKARKIDNAEALVFAAMATGLPLHIAAAFAEKESGGRNIYGHDRGGAMYGAGAVTAANYATFYDLVMNKRKTSNGVGPMQITYKGYHPVAKKQGLKLWVPFDNFCFGFDLLVVSLRGDYSVSRIQRAGTLYNAGNLNAGVNAYGYDVAKRAVAWATRLRDADLPNTLSRGDDGASVKALQAGLVRRFPALAGSIVSSGGADGSFGPGTQEAVERFQSFAKLTVDGRVGPRTRGRLTEYGILVP